MCLQRNSNLLGARIERLMTKRRFGLDIYTKAKLPSVEVCLSTYPSVPVSSNGINPPFEGSFVTMFMTLFLKVLPYIEFYYGASVLLSSNRGVAFPVGSPSLDANVTELLQRVSPLSAGVICDGSSMGTALDLEECANALLRFQYPQTMSDFGYRGQAGIPIELTLPNITISGMFQMNEPPIPSDSDYLTPWTKNGHCQLQLFMPPPNFYARAKNSQMQSATADLLQQCVNRSPPSGGIQSHIRM